jgi:GT2 family glycosyltransferase
VNESVRDNGARRESEAVSVIVVTHNSAGDIGLTLACVAAQLLPGDELIVVDNGSADGTPQTARDSGKGAKVIEQGNLGFAAGCATGAGIAHGELLFFLNPDTRLAKGALAALREASAAHPAWWCWQPVLELPDGAVNSAGNDVHFTGIGWAGRYGISSGQLPEGDYAAAFASGAALVVRHDRWRELGGMEDRYFMYAEDLDLGLRTWLRGGTVGVVPAARVTHEYEFAKGAYKWRLLERNRLATVLTVWPAGLLFAILPALLITELALVAVAARGRWLGALLRGWAGTLVWLPWILARRRRVQAGRAISTAEFATLLKAEPDSPFAKLPDAVAPTAGAAMRAYWRAVSALTGRPRRRLLDNHALDHPAADHPT